MRARRLLARGFLFVYAVLVMGLLWSPNTALAATAENCINPEERASFLNFPTWYKYLNPRFEAGECVIDFRLQDNANVVRDISAIAMAMFEIILRIGGIVAVIFVIYGGFLFLVSNGEPDKAKAGRTTILNAVIGLVIATLAVAIVNVIGRNVI